MKRRRFARVANRVWRWFFGLVVGGALVMGLGLGALYALAWSPALAQQVFTWMHGHPVRLEKVAVNPWSAYPGIYVTGLRVETRDGRAQLRLAHVQASLDLFNSVFQRRLRIHRFAAINGAIATSLANSPHQRAAPVASVADIPAWIREAEWLSLRAIDVAIAHPAQPVDVQNLSAELRNLGYGHRLTVDFRLPQLELAQPIPARARGGRFHLVATGRFDAMAEWRGQAELRGLRVAAWEGPAQTVNTEIDFALRPGVESGWQWEVRPARIRVGDRTWPPLNLKGNLFSTPETVRVWLRHLPLSPLLQSAAAWLPAPWREAARQTDPDTVLREVAFTRAPDGGELRARFEHRSNQPWGDWPGVKNLRGSLWLTPDEGYVLLDSEQLEVQAPAHFSAPLSVDTLSGSLAWRKSGADWLVDIPGLKFSDPAIAAGAVHGQVRVPPQGAPVADLRLHLLDGVPAQIYRYLPDVSTNGRAREWLRDSLRQGKVRQGQAMLRGPLDRLPFAHGEGELRARFEVEDLLVRYKPGWPALREVHGTVFLEGPKLRIAAREGKVFSVRLRDTEVEIPDLGAKKPRLEARGHARGAGEEGLRYIRESPLNDRVDVGQDGLSIGGDIDLALRLRVPLHSGGDTLTGGTIRFLRGSSLHSQSLDITLREMSGKIHFDDATLRTENLRAKLFEQPVELALTDEADDRGRFTRATLRGAADQTFLRTLFLHLDKRFPYLHWLDNLRGAAPWEAWFDFPKNQPSPRAVDIRVTSDLVGLDTGLPYPMNKSADQVIPLEVRSRFIPDQGAGLWLRYDDVVEVDLEPGLDQGTIVLYPEQNGPASPARVGELRIVGHLPVVDGEAWLPYLLETNQPEEVYRIPDPPRATWVEVSAEAVDVGLNRFHDVEIHAINTPPEWLVHLDSQELMGKLVYQQQREHAEVVLNRLILNPDPDAPPQPVPRYAWQPRQLPDLRLRCEAFSYLGRDFGEFALEAYPVAEGLRISPFTLRAGETELRGTGFWRFADNRTEADALLESQDLGLTLNRLAGSEDPPMLSGARTHAVFKGGWPGPPWSMSLHSVAGDLDIRADKGRLTEVEPGAMARSFGLLTLDTLPDRLKLDFDDVFGEGLGFREMSGKLRVANGLAQGEDFVVQSPTARIELGGGADILQQTYDLRMHVVPHAAGSTPLPVAGALMGGLGIGAAILLIQKMLEPELEKSINYQYQVKGPWWAPEITPVER